MKEWWMNLGLREKQFVSSGSLIILLFLLYEIMWAPISYHNDDLRNEILRNQKLLIWMQQADHRIQATQKMLQRNTTIKTPAALLSILQKEVKQSPIANNLNQINQAENNSVQMTFQKVNFDLLAKWLTDLWLKHGLSVSQMTATPNGAMGIVDATVTISL